LAVECLDVTRKVPTDSAANPRYGDGDAVRRPRLHPWDRHAIRGSYLSSFRPAMTCSEGVAQMRCGRADLRLVFVRGFRG